MLIEKSAYWIFTLVTPAVLLILWWLCSLVIKSLIHGKNIPASASDTDSEAVKNLVGIGKGMGLVFGILIGMYVCAQLSYWGVDLLKDKASPATSSSTGGITTGGGNPSGLAKASTAAPTGAEYEKSSGKVKSLSTRPTDFRMQIQFKDAAAKEQHIDGGEVVEFTIPANVTDVKIRWWKGSEVTDWTTAAVK